jgi:hypothetical protein
MVFLQNFMVQSFVGGGVAHRRWHLTLMISWFMAPREAQTEARATPQVSPPPCYKFLFLTTPTQGYRARNCASPVNQLGSHFPRLWQSFAVYGHALKNSMIGL